MNPIMNNRNKIENIRPDSDMDFDLKASHVTTVKNAIPNIHENEPLAIILENPSHKIKESIDHIDNFRKYFKNSISNKE